MTRLALASVALVLVACGAEEDSVTIRGCSLPHVELVALAGHGLCTGQDPAGVPAGEALDPLARAIWDDPASTDPPKLDVGEAEEVTLVARCADDAGVVRQWGCDDDADDRLVVEAAPVCREDCDVEAGACANGSVPWSGAGPEICVARCGECHEGPCATGDPEANGGCDWECNDPLAPSLVLTAFEVTAPEALVGGAPQDLVDDALADGSLVFLVDLDGRGGFVLGVGECDGSSCSFSGADGRTARGAAAYDPGDGALRAPAEGGVDLVLGALGAVSDDALPLHDVVLTATVGHDGNCIGSFGGSAWATAGELRSKLTVEDAEAVQIEALGSLCDFIAGTSCDTPDRESWQHPPDTQVGGEPAWTLSADVAAIGVEIN